MKIMDLETKGGSTLLKMKIERKESLKIFIQSDIIEDWMKANSLIGQEVTSSGSCYVGKKGYRLKESVRAAICVDYYFDNWGSNVIDGQDLSKLRVVGLKEGVTFEYFIPVSADKISEYVNKTKERVVSWYRSYLKKLDVELTVIAKEVI